MLPLLVSLRWTMGGIITNNLLALSASALSLKNPANAEQGVVGYTA